MDYVKAVIIISALFALLIYFIVLEVKSIKLLARLTEKYENGIDIGCNSLVELGSILEKECGLFIILYPTYLVARVGKRKIKFFVEDGRVFAEYSKDKFGITRASMQSNRLLRASRLRKAVAVNEIMDKLNMKYNPTDFVLDNGNYQKAYSYATQYNVIFGLSALIAVGIFAYQTINSTINPIEPAEDVTSEVYVDSKSSFVNESSSGVAYKDNENVLENSEKGIETGGSFAPDKDFEKNEITSDNISDNEISDYIIPYSDTRYLSQQDLMGMNKGTLRAARNEIYARYGRKFKAKDLQDYFNSKSWYHPTIEADQFTDNMLSDIERHNANLIKEAEAEAPEGKLILPSDELLSMGEKEKIVSNMEEYSTWEIEMRVMNEQTNEYDLWTIKDDLKNNDIAIKKNGSDWAYYDVNAGMSVGDPTFNIEKALMDDETYISGFWNARESIFKNFKPNDKSVNNGYVIYDSRPEDGQGWFVSYRFKKDSNGKLLLREIFSTRSSFNYPDEVITYKYSNEPITAE